MVKLDASIAEAKKLGLKPGANGWVKAVFARGVAPPKGVLERWIAESHALMSAAEEEEELLDPIEARRRNLLRAKHLSAMLEG